MIIPSSSAFCEVIETDNKACDWRAFKQLLLGTNFSRLLHFALDYNRIDWSLWHSSGFVCETNERIAIWNSLKTTFAFNLVTPLERRARERDERQTTRQISLEFQIFTERLIKMELRWSSCRSACKIWKILSTLSRVIVMGIHLVSYRCDVVISD